MFPFRRELRWKTSYEVQGYFCMKYELSLVPRPFQSKRGEEGSGDSGQDVVTQWNAIMGILCNCLLAMRADRMYPNCCGDCFAHFFDPKVIFFDLARHSTTIDNTSVE